MKKVVFPTITLFVLITLFTVISYAQVCDYSFDVFLNLEAFEDRKLSKYQFPDFKEGSYLKIKNIKIFDTYRSAITFAAVDGGIVENIEVDSVRAINTGNAIFLRIGDRRNYGTAPKMQNVSISNVYAEIPLTKPDAGYHYEGPVEDNPRNTSPASIVGLPEYKIQDVVLKNIEIV